MKKEDLDAEGKPKSNNTGKSKLTAELMMFKLQSPSLAQAHHRPVSPPVFFFLKITSAHSISLQETPRAPFLVSIPQISLAVVFVLLRWQARALQGLSVQWCHSQSFAWRESVPGISSHSHSFIFPILISAKEMLVGLTRE